MAQLLIKAVSVTHADSTKDKGCYKRGDIVLVREDSHVWGALEALPPAQGGQFVIVTVTTHTAAQLKALAQSKWGIDLDGQGDRESEDYRRRVIRIDVDALPAGVKSQLNTTGRYSATLTQVRNFILNKSNAEAL